MNNADRIALIKEKLTATLQPTVLSVEDESAKHQGHPGAQSGAGHFAVIIAAPAFHGKSLVACHRLIYAALDDLMPREIHALRITLLQSRR